MQSSRPAVRPLVGKSIRSSLDRPSTSSATSGLNFSGQLMLAHALVFHHVVQQGVDSALASSFQPAQISVTAMGLGNVRRAAGAELAQVGLVGDGLRAFDPLRVE